MKKNRERDVWKVKSTLFVPGYHGSWQRACWHVGLGNWLTMEYRKKRESVIVSVIEWSSS